MESMSIKLPLPIKPLLQAINPAQSQAIPESTTHLFQDQESSISLTTPLPPTSKTSQLTRQHPQESTKQELTKVELELDLEFTKAEPDLEFTRVEVDLESIKAEQAQEFIKQEADLVFTRQAHTRVAVGKQPPTKVEADHLLLTKLEAESLEDMDHRELTRLAVDPQEPTKAEQVEPTNPTNLDRASPAAATNLEHIGPELEPQELQGHQELQEHQVPSTHHQPTNTRKSEQ